MAGGEARFQEVTILIPAGTALTIQPIGAYFSGRGSGTDYVLTR